MTISVNTSSKKELFNDLKIKFMLLASIIGTAILLIIFIAIFAAQYGDMQLSIKDSLFTTIEDFKSNSGAGSEFDDFDTRNHCILLVERNGIIVIKQHFDGYTPTEQSQIINIVINTDNERVAIGKRHFQILKESTSNYVFDETVYAIYDYTMEYNSIMIMVIAFSCSIILSAWLFSLIGWLFAKHAVKPVEYAFHNQKELVTNVSHELKTPLAIIGANMYLIKSDPGATVAENEHWIENVDAQLARMSALITDMLELFRADSQTTGVKTEENLSEMLDGILLSFEARCFEKNIELTQHISPAITLNCYAKQMERLFNILMDNALKYTPEKGRIDVEMKSDKRGVNAVFTNYGTGIAKEHLTKIFDRFYRVDNARTQSAAAGSFGLGLSLAKNIVMNHDGEIECDSDGSTYTKFIVRLPKSGAQTALLKHSKKEKE